MALPAFAMFFLLHTIPVIQGFFYSFTDYAGYGSWNWVGLKNYDNLFNDDRIRNSYWFTIKFAVVATILINIVSLAIATFLNSKIKFRTAFRGIFFMPFVMSILIVGYIFNFMFANSLPWFGEKLGIDWLSTNILANEDLAWLGIVAVQTWSSDGLHDHHLPRRAADDRPAAVRGGVARRGVGLAAVPVDHVPAARRVLHDQHGDHAEVRC